MKTKQNTVKLTSQRVLFQLILVSGVARICQWKWGRWRSIEDLGTKPPAAGGWGSEGKDPSRWKQVGQELQRWVIFANFQ